MLNQKEWVKKSDEEIQAEKDALQRAKLKQKLQKQRLKAEKLRQKYQIAKQESLKQEEASKQEKLKQGEDAKQEFDKIEGNNKQEAAKLAEAIEEEKELRKDMQPEPAQADPTPPFNPTQAGAPSPEPHV
jgi:septal ring factor EnvC (AmiA/AmiB activator)